MSNPRPKPRTRILETADRLFYAEGIRVVGIDRIIAEAEVAKMTLYNHFATKDELILEVLKLREQRIDTMFEEAIARQTSRGRNQLDAFFATLKQWFESAGFRGCSFINATAELADPSHPAVEFSVAHKRRFHKRIRDCVVASYGQQAGSLAPAVALLVEGAIVSAVMEQSAKPADAAKRAAAKLFTSFS